MGRRKPPAGDAKRAIAYLRVSTDRQEHGPEAQRAVLTSWAARNGVQIVDWIPEEESGASTIEERPELQRALAALRTKGAGVFLAAKRDRIAREVTIARDIAVRVRELGAVVVTADGMSDTDDRPDSRLREGISDLFAEHERRQIAERTRAALEVMRTKGLRTGKAPYGFQIAAQGPPSKKSGRPLPLVPHEGEQVVCAYVMRLHARGASVPRIELELQERGVKSRGGRRLEQKQIRRIIANCERLRAVFPDHAGGETNVRLPGPIDEFDLIEAAELVRPVRVLVAESVPQGRALSCGRGHVHDGAREGDYCCRDECASGRGTYAPERRIEWRKRDAEEDKSQDEVQ